MVWTKDEILRELRRLYKAGKDISYNRLARATQPLLSAAAYHFGSYRRAIKRAGIDYDSLIRRPRWNRQKIVALIKSARRRGEDLHWSAVTQRRDELGRAAFASLQDRLFGSWVRALRAAGLDANDVARYRHWDRSSIVTDLRARASSRKSLNSGSLQAQDAGLHAAAVRHFGSYDAALRAARLEPERIRQRRKWDKPAVLRAIREARREGLSLADSGIRRESPALYGAAVRLFGAFTTAQRAAGIQFSRKRPRKPRA